MKTLNDFFFNVYPYVCLAFFLMGMGLVYVGAGRA